MIIPNMPDVARQRDFVAEFTGIDRREVIGGGAFADVENLSPRKYPCVASRELRALLPSYTDPIVGMLGKQQLCAVTQSTSAVHSLKFFYGGEEEPNVSGKLNPAIVGERQLVSMGANVVIFPDKVMYNTITREAVYLEQRLSIPTTAEPIHFELSFQDGSEMIAGDYEDFDPETAENGSYWLDNSGKVPAIKLYNADTGLLSPVGTTFTKISHSSLMDANGNPLFKEGDGVQISGFTNVGNHNFEQFNTNMLVWSSGSTAGDGWIVVTALLDSTSVDYTVSAAVTFSREWPEMEYIIEHDNRLWGCHFGGAKNELYSCKLGDPTNWNCFMGIASDSYAVSLGSDGVFTGAAVHDGTILFFKENFIHKVYGSKPSNYQVTTVPARGVREGSWRSCCIVNETLFYLSKTGIVAYTGGEPAQVDDALGDVRFTDGVGGALGGYYYICITDRKTEKRFLYVLDTDHAIWHKETGDIKMMTNLRSDLFAYGEGQLVVLNGESCESSIVKTGMEGQVEWYAETGDIGLTTPDEKYYSFFQIRFEAGEGAVVKVALKYDSEGEWIEKYKLTAKNKRAVTLPLLTPRCDHFRIRFSGKGDFTLLNVSKFYEGGGDRVYG